MVPTPSVLATLICDQIIVDAQNQKKTLVGVFEKVIGSQLPIAQRLGFFARITDAEGNYTFTVRVVHLDDTEELVGQLEFPQAQVGSRLGILDLAVNLPAVILPKFGPYEFQLYANDQYVGRVTLEVIKAEV